MSPLLQASRTRYLLCHSNRNRLSRPPLNFKLNLKEDLVTRLAQADEANSMWGRNYDGSGYVRSTSGSGGYFPSQYLTNRMMRKVPHWNVDTKLQLALKAFRIAVELTMPMNTTAETSEQKDGNNLGTRAHVQVLRS